MKTVEKQTMGRFKVDVELANNRDVMEAELGHLPRPKFGG